MRNIAVLLLLSACHGDADSLTDASIDAPRDIGPPVTPSEHRLALSDTHSCYLDDEGAGYCWGADDANQLGDPSNRLSQSVPVPVTVVDRAVEIAAGGGLLDGHTLVRVENGDIKGWGANSAGQLGDAMTVPPLTITTAVNRFKGDQLVASSRHTCARGIVIGDGDTRVFCWGKNDHGQLLLPVEVLGALSPLGLGIMIEQVAVGADHVCVLPTDGSPRCWGRNQLRQTGAPEVEDQRMAVTVQGLTATSSAIGTGYAHSCAIDAAAGGVRCWGDNARGQLGDGSVGVLEGTNVPAVVTGLAGPATAVCGGEAHTCARLASGAVQCWGANDQGQLGDGSNADRRTPVSVVGIDGVAEIACGGNHTCARLAAGGVRCWGANDHGQLGDGSTTARNVPVVAQGL